MTHDPIQDAIDRGNATASLVIAHRDALIHHLAALLLITGVEGLKACAAGAVEATLIAHNNLSPKPPSEGLQS